MIFQRQVTSSSCDVFFQQIFLCSVRVCGKVVPRVPSKADRDGGPGEGPGGQVQGVLQGQHLQELLTSVECNKEILTAPVQGLHPGRHLGQLLVLGGLLPAMVRQQLQPGVQQEPQPARGGHARGRRVQVCARHLIGQTRVT